MQETSDLYRKILAADNHWYETRVKIGNTYYSESTIMSVSTSTAMFSGDPEIGKAVAGEISLKMISPSVAIPRMEKVEPSVRICGKVATPNGVSSTGNNLVLENGSSVSNEILTVEGATVSDSVYVFPNTEYSLQQSEWIPKGTFYIDTRETTKNGDGLNILSVHGFDAMLFAEREYPSTELQWPALDTDVVREIASFMGVEVDERTWDVMTSTYALPLPVGYTMREELGYIASMYVGSFVMTDAGKLRLVSILDLPEETNYLIDYAGDRITFGGYRILV